MGENKNNKGLICLIVILIILVLGLVGYIVYDKVLKVDKTISNNDETTASITTTTKKVSNEISSEKINIENYIGNWYINKEHAQATTQLNPTTLYITSANNVRLYITRIGDFNIKLNDDFKTFIGTSENAPSKNNDDSSIEGTIVFLGHSIKINITKSNVLYLEDNQEYTFTISFDTNKGEFLSIEYNENIFTLYDSSIDIKSYKTTDIKINNAKIFNSPLSSDASESAFIIMENGDVYLSYFGEESNELKFMQYDAFKEYDIEDIISCDEGFEQKCEVILKDGSRKTI